MDSIRSKSARLADTLSSGWIHGGVWLALVVLFGWTYETNRISLGTLVLAEICALALGVFVLIFGHEMRQPPEIVEQMLYRIETSGPTMPPRDRAVSGPKRRRGLISGS